MGAYRLSGNRLEEAIPGWPIARIESCTGSSSAETGGEPGGSGAMKVFIEAEAGSFEKGRYDESSLERLGTRRANRPYPYPYGFVLGTRTEDGDAVDCYVVTNDRLRQGDTVECEPVGLLEMLEDGEADHKVVAALPGRAVRADESLRKTLRDFIIGVFKAYPEVKVEVGALLPAAEAVAHIARSRGP